MPDHDAVRTVTDDSFAEAVLGSTRPVVVDFWAPWCGPCKQLAPLLDELAAEYGDTITFAKLDVDANPDTGKSLRVMALPTLVVFRDGAEVHRIVGAKTKAELTDALALIGQA